MKIKLLSISILALMICNIFIASASVTHKESVNKSSEDDDTVVIRVALYTDEPEDQEFYSQFRRTRYFVYALRNYSWTVGDTTYTFNVDFVTTKMVLDGKLTIQNYDVMIYPPDQADGKASMTISKYQPKYLIEKQRIINFIEQGGGYFGTCAGAVIAGEVVNQPGTYMEHAWENLCYGFAEVDSDHQSGMPLFPQLKGLPPESIGPTGAYFWYSGWNQTDYDINYHGGTCFDVPVNKNTAIFDDFIGETCRIRWIGGPTFVIPEESEREIQVLATYPEEELSDNESTQFHYWKYDGGYLGFLKGLLYKGGDIHYFTQLGLFLKAYLFAGDWSKTDSIVETNFANKPFMVSEFYPNENAARIVRCAGHPEHNVWWGGYIQEREDTDYDSQYEGFYKWTGTIPENETIEDEFNYTHWILRRSVAWASQKVPDSDLPAVYGESEVCDFESENYPLNFNVNCNVKIEEDPVELDLYYRYSLDQVNWSGWTFFGTDSDSSDGFGFEFNSPNGTGYYEFYSIRRVVHLGGTEIERVPPGADSKVFVNE
jgi:glutamine amidotransferase-like uncharacterized protein